MFRGFCGVFLVKREEPKLTSPPTCPGSQTNCIERYTNGNYIGRVLSDRNYPWKSGLFLPASEETGASKRPRGRG